ncbi:unnamed protein product [Rangifer tarandus platyrhynchus]|uniref:Uncharacterized protein n=1 Tax=Rangifer tarandus platyrhynchus TaxID=3082113 RepID=A0AC59ZQD0_RANTA
MAFTEKRFLPGAPADPEPECPLLSRRSPHPPGGLSRGCVSQPWSLGCGTKSASKEGAGKLDFTGMKDFCVQKDTPEDERSADHTPGGGRHPRVWRMPTTPQPRASPAGTGKDVSRPFTSDNPAAEGGSSPQLQGRWRAGAGSADRTSSKPPALLGWATNSISRLHDSILLLC